MQLPDVVESQSEDDNDDDDDVPLTAVSRGKLKIIPLID